MNFYRYKDSFGNLVLLECRVLRDTPAGKWARNPLDSSEHFVRNHARKKFAYPTKLEALIGFIKRTERHIMMAEGNIEAKRKSLHEANARLLVLQEEKKETDEKTAHNL